MADKIGMGTTLPTGLIASIESSTKMDKNDTKPKRHVLEFDLEGCTVEHLVNAAMQHWRISFQRSFRDDKTGKYPDGGRVVLKASEMGSGRGGVTLTPERAVEVILSLPDDHPAKVALLEKMGA